MKRRPIDGSDAGDPPEIEEKRAKLDRGEQEEGEVIISPSKEDAAPELGDDLVFEILKRADARSLAASACVSRRWRSLAEDERLWEAVCTRHWASIGCGNQQLRSVVLALGGFRRHHSLYLLPLLRPTAGAGRPRPALPLPLLAASRSPSCLPARCGKDELLLSLSLLSIGYFEKMNLNYPRPRPGGGGSGDAAGSGG
ncbi:F-box protein GID2 [Dendrobium catenatum]|uniref:F-box protein GID2 n=1 Tax=Dendrobium catenatum TaxID=906689 RepID=A0A2I0VV95_9ASPA|nr:F-box protein GID2 [Dendrobium catenatum]PKU67330.1 F-box protein GID2 [Dendrobium catenatum]